VPISIVFVVALFSTLFLSAGPASAQIQGYGKNATGGAGGSVCTVTTSASSGTGSFSSCLSQGNRTIQFAVASATVGGTQYVKSNTTIDGCANGRNGVTLDQSGGSRRSVVIEGPVSNIIVRCLRFQGPGGTSEGSDLLGLDGTGGQISRIAIDRSTFVGAADGALDITGDVSDVTVQYSLFYGSGLTQLIKYQTRTRISIHHNVYTAGGERNPQIKGDATAFDFVSNVVHANTLVTDAHGTRLWNGNSSSDSPGNVQINMAANAFLGTKGNLIIQSDSGASASGIYIAPNNYCSPASNCPSSPASSPRFAVPAANAVTVTLPGCMATAMLPSVGSPNRTTTDTQRLNAVVAALPNSCRTYGACAAPAASPRFFTVKPCRVVDTRGTSGVPIGGPALGSGGPRDFLLRGQCNVPATAKAVSLNVTVVFPTGPGFVRFSPSCQMSTASTLNFGPDQTRANNAVLPLGATDGVLTGDALITGGGTVQLLLDVNGYFE
jgi:pectate lyase